MESILSFSRDADGNQTGSWISFWGINELQDIEYSEGNLSFSWVVNMPQGETRTSKFTGTIEDGALSGTLSGEMGEMKVEGERMPRTPRICGSWEMKISMGEREFTSTLVITADDEGELAGEWVSQWGENEITDLQYERGALSFKRTTKVQDREFESTFEGTVEGNAITGMIKSERGEAEVTGSRIGEDLIGTWMLEITSDRGARNQRLRVNPDLSALYGSIAVDKVELADNAVSFKVEQTFGERTFEISFAGTIDGNKMTGTLTTTRGTQEVKGEKVVRNFQRRGMQQQ
jgi:hypothetical protein